MLFYPAGMCKIAAVLVLTAILAGCGSDAGTSNGDEERRPAAGRKAASSPASVISVLGVRG